MIESVKNPSRLSACIDNTLAQLKDKEEVFYYSITEKDLFFWTSCPLCQSENIKRISEVYLNKEFLFFTTDICQSCLHIFRAISPNLDWFSACWKRISTGELCVYNEALEEKRKNRYEMYYSFLNRYLSEGLLLDIGAAYGSGTSVFLERGFAAEALEPEHDRAEYIKQIYRIPVYGCTIEGFEPTDQKYDAIIFAHCLEHLNDPIDALKRMKNWLTDQGVIYLEIPMAWKFVDWQDSLFMAHKHNFIEKNIKSILDSLGYVILDSYLIPDADAAFCNLAMIVTQTTSSYSFENPNRKNKPVNLFDPPHFDSQDLENLYRIQFPITELQNSVLKYNVPFINHFYYIIRREKDQFICDGQYISYEYKK